MARLYVGNIPYATSEAEIRHLFLDRVKVEVDKVALQRDRDTNRPRGFVFVELQDKSQADAAIEALNGTSFKGRMLIVDEECEGEGVESGVAHC